MLRPILKILGAIFSLLTMGLVAAGLVIGAAFWFYSRDLPSHDALAQYAPPTISRIYSGEGMLIDEFAQERRLFAPAEDIPDRVKDAFISAEDSNFHDHPGYDPRGIAVAIYDAIASRGEVLRGASTITQQVTRNFLLTADRTGERKIQEIILATRLEQTLDKDAILELYLNEIFLGQNSYGVVAAAQTYFNKSLDELELHEAAFLAALPQAPSRYHPVRAHDRVLERRNWVLGQMHRNGYIDEDALAAARAEPLETVQSGDFEAFSASLPARDYFTDEIRRQLAGDFGESEFFGGGLTIRATIDPEMQEVAGRALRDGLQRYDRQQGIWRGTGEALDAELLDDESAWRGALRAASVPRDIEGWRPAVVLSTEGGSARLGVEGLDTAPGGDVVEADDVTWARPQNPDGTFGDRAQVPGDLVSAGEVVLVAPLDERDAERRRWSLRQVSEVQGGLMAMDVNTGRVIAMQGGFSYQHSSFNRATQAERQPGSAFKPFVFAAALDSGYSPATIVIDAPIEVDTGGGGIWRPSNYSDRFYGPTPVRTGIEMSRNLMTVRLAREIGMDRVADYAERFGVYETMQGNLANALGSQETTLHDMVAAFAMFANGGERVEPTLVDRVQDRWGETIYRHDARECTDCDDPDLAEGRAPFISADRERVMDEVTAYQLTSMMEGVVQRGTASRIDLPVPIAGKTGTTNDTRDVWFVGFSSNIVAGCYVGHDSPRPLGQGATGGGTCGPIFEDFMREAVAKYGGGAFETPLGGEFIRIDRFSGERLPDDAEGEHVVAEFFRSGEEPVFGSAALVDGGFEMGSDLPTFNPGEDDPGVQREAGEGGGDDDDRAGFGTLSSGGLY